jgi:hypothetical protein
MSNAERGVKDKKPRERGTNAENHDQQIAEAVCTRDLGFRSSFLGFLLLLRIPHSALDMVFCNLMWAC